jgi:DNA-binding transcriptional ArsR family regulator
MLKKSKKIGNKRAKNTVFLQVSDFLKLLADENRLRILLALTEETMSVTQIHEKLKLPQNLTSHHISKLKEMDLLNEKRDGVFRYYSLNAQKLKECNRLLKELLKI